MNLLASAWSLCFAAVLCVFAMAFLTRDGHARIMLSKGKSDKEMNGLDIGRAAWRGKCI